MGSMQQRKGDEGERELARYLREKWNIGAIRGKQNKGGYDSPDVIVDVEGIQIECKRQETNLNMKTVLDKLKKECGDRVPMVFHRKNHQKWMLTIYADDFDSVVHAIFRGNNEQTKA